MTLLGTTNNPFGKSGRRYEERTSLTDFLNQIEQRDQMYKNLPKPSKEEIENRRISEEERRLEDIAFNNKALAVGTVLCLGEGFYHGITGNYLPGKLLIPFLTAVAFGGGITEHYDLKSDEGETPIGEGVIGAFAGGGLYAIGYGIGKLVDQILS